MEKRRDLMGKLLKRLFCVILILAGLTIFFMPDALTAVVDRDTEYEITTFETSYPGEDGDGEETMEEMDALLDTIKKYNQDIYESGQAEFKDAWSYEQPPIELSGLKGDVFGYIEVPAMGIEYPLYLGASSSNMRKGCAVLGETSIPIGGENTNSVIAGHRGYSGIPFFRNIEALSAGDSVYITNPWGTLTYRVESIKVIDPNDVDAVKIQEGRDMVTLLTCHPYRSGGIYRYLVYCVRDDTSAEEGTEGNPEIIEHSTLVEVPNSSVEDIAFEQLIRLIGKVLIVAVLAITILSSAIRKIRRKNRPYHRGNTRSHR